MQNKNSAFSLSYYISRNKPRKSGQVPITMKVYLCGDVVTLSTKRLVMPKDWDPEYGCARGRSPGAKVLNDYLDSLKLHAFKKYNELLIHHDEVTAQLLKDAILGVDSARPKMFVEIWEEHNQRLKKMIGLENSYTNYQKHNTCKNHFVDFLSKEYKLSDLPVKKMEPDLVDRFMFFLKTEKSCSHNTTIKFMHKLKGICIICQRNGWMLKDPFYGIKLGLKDVDRPYLTEAELQRLIDYQSPIDRMIRVRDFFLFACFTGLAYSDVKKLKRSELETNGNAYWIRTKRQKTGAQTSVPLLEPAMRIIRKYTRLELLNDNDPVLPISSNQKINAYLKELADICGISKVLSFHIARHTFATTVTLTNGVPIESVSKMLGHKNLRSTQHYARIVDKKVGDDMAMLADKLSSKLKFRE
jgi:integrase